MSWPPDYKAIFEQRLDIMRKLQGDTSAQGALKKYYKDNPVAYIEDWGVTHDPRNAKSAQGLPTLMPFILFEKQRECVRWLASHVDSQDDGLIEKARDMGATWLCVAVSVWMWTFYPGSAIGWGSMTAKNLDNLGDGSSIFEKIRRYIQMQPPFLQPPGLVPSRHLMSMRCVNPANESTIIGEVGDNIGRSGRTTVFFKDESAHYEHAEQISGALDDNTNVQIDISSVNGTGNVFHRRRMALPDDDVFIFDWRDHPNKTQEWYDARRARAVEMGLEHIFLQEVDRDYAAAVVGVCIPSAWVKAAVGLKLDDSGGVRAGLDVATEGGADFNALIIRKGPNVLPLGKHERTWKGLDGTETALKADGILQVHGGRPGETIVNYDAHGVGANIQAPAKRTKMEFRPVYVGSTKLPGLYEPVLPIGVEDEAVDLRDIPKIRNKDFFKNKKARLWWLSRDRFYRTWRYVNGEADYSHDDLVSLPAKGTEKLVMQLSQPRIFQSDSGKRSLETKQQLSARGISSPDEAEAFILSYDDGAAIAAEPSIRRL